MMRILWVKANKILPVHSGGDLRSFNILRQLAVREEIVFFSYYDGPADAEYERNLQEQLPGAVCVSTGRGTVLACGPGGGLPVAIATCDSVRCEPVCIR